MGRKGKRWEGKGVRVIKEGREGGRGIKNFFGKECGMQRRKEKGVDMIEKQCGCGGVGRRKGEERERGELK